jgi:hypothetical protein
MREEEWRIEAITAGQVRASRPGQRRVLGFCTPQGGWCRISSAVGAGTVVELWIPLE